MGSRTFQFSCSCSSSCPPPPHGPAPGGNGFSDSKHTTRGRKACLYCYRKNGCCTGLANSGNKAARISFADKTLMSMLYRLQRFFWSFYGFSSVVFSDLLCNYPTDVHRYIIHTTYKVHPWSNHMHDDRLGNYLLLMLQWFNASLFRELPPSPSGGRSIEEMQALSEDTSKTFCCNHHHIRLLGFLRQLFFLYELLWGGRRELIHSVGGSYFYLWFFAEKERLLFLQELFKTRWQMATLQTMPGESCSGERERERELAVLLLHKNKTSSGQGALAKKVKWRNGWFSCCFFTEAFAMEVQGHIHSSTD